MKMNIDKPRCTFYSRSLCVFYLETVDNRNWIESFIEILSSSIIKACRILSEGIRGEWIATMKAISYSSCFIQNNFFIYIQFYIFNFNNVINCFKKYLCWNIGKFQTHNFIKYSKLIKLSKYIKLYILFLI